jgi:GDP-L-fucose synthase
MEKGAKIYIAGDSGLVGSCLVSRLKQEGYANLITRSHQQLDLLRQSAVEDFFAKEQPEYVFLLAAKVGGIQANIAYPADFIYQNTMIQANLMQGAYLSKAKKLLFFGSACSYPRECPLPMKEEYLLSGHPEETNKAYAMAKLCGLEMCQAYQKQYGVNFIAAILTNVYGPHDNFDPQDAHVIPALIRRFHEAKINRLPQVEVWGSGRPRREFIYVDDAASAAIFLMRNYQAQEPINLAVGKDYRIKDLVRIIKDIVGYSGRIEFDRSKPDGIPRKVLDASRLKRLGWQAKVPLEEGLRRTYEWYSRYKG